MLQLHELPLAVDSPVGRTKENEYDPLRSHQRFQGTALAGLIQQGKFGGCRARSGPNLGSVAQALKLPPQRKARERGNTRDQDQVHRLTSV
jgi:hypothetical protein